MLYSVQAGFLRQNITPALFPCRHGWRGVSAQQKSSQNGSFLYRGYPLPGSFAGLLGLDDLQAGEFLPFLLLQ